MKNNKILALTLSMMLGMSSLLNVGTVFAENIEISKTERTKKIENEIIGKITAINATSVTIEVAERKEMEKPKDGQKPDGAPKEKPANDGSQDKKEKPNMDNMFTLTGNTKTINISSAQFVGGFRGRKDGEKNKNNEAKNDNNDVKKEKTYADYSVGDYISIELTDATSLTARTVRDAMFGGPRGGRPDGEPPKNDSSKNN